MWADTATFSYIDYDGQGKSGTGGFVTATVDNITISCSNGYGNTSYTQFYAKGRDVVITPSKGMTISKVTIKATGKDYNGGTWSSLIGKVTSPNSTTTITWTGMATEEFTLTKDKQLRWTTIDVTYTVAAPTTSYTVTFDNSSDKGTCETSSLTEEEPGCGIILPACTPNDGYEFAGWATTADATTADAGRAGETYKPSGDITLYAVYTKLYTVTIETPENGSLTVKNGKTDIVSGSCFAYGTVLTIVPTPADGYKFKNWQYNDDGTWTTKTTNFDYTVSGSNVAFRANFDKIIYNTITWSVNGVTSTTTVENGTAIDFNAPTENIPSGYVFMGWSDKEIPAQQTSPEYVTDATANGNVTYYAVFAKATGSGTAGEKLSQTLNYPEWSTSGDTYDKGDYLILRKDAYVESKEFDLSKLVKVVVYGGSYGDKNCNRLKIGDGTNTWKEVTVKDNGENTKNIYTKGNSLSGTGTLRITALSGQKGTGNNIGTGIRMTSVEIYISEPAYTYSGYCTSVSKETETYTAATLTLSAVSGNDHYATFSSDNVTFFPSADEDITFMTEVQTVYSDGSDLLLTNLADATATIDDAEVAGYFVPANTGVLVKVAFDNSETTIPYYTVAGKNVEGLTDNMLRPSSVEMTGDYLFYKLAYDDYSAKTGLGFYWGNENGEAFDSAKGLAYLAVPKTTNAKPSFVFGETAGIKGVETNASDNEVMYNLAGMRVNSNYKGIVIVNGKKMIRK